jgi:hypothetical protein
MAKKQKAVGKSAVLQLREKDTVLSGEIIEQDGNGVWLTPNKETTRKLGVKRPTDVFIPFSSIYWMTLA